MGGKSLWRCFDINEVGQFSQALYNAMPQSFRNFFDSFFYNGRTDLLVYSPFGYRRLDGKLDFHYGTDVVPKRVNLYPYFGIVTDLLLVNVGFHMKINNQNYLRPNYNRATGYGWFATFQPTEAVSDAEAKKWLLFFGHLDAPPFRLKNSLPSGYSLIGRPNSSPARLSFTPEDSNRLQRTDPDSKYIKGIRKVILDTADGYDQGDNNSRAKLLVYENNKIIEYQSITYEELRGINKNSQLITQFDGIENGKFPVGFTYTIRRELNSSDTNSIINQRIALLMGSTGLSQGVHYHINFIYNCYYLDILEVIKNSDDRPSISHDASRGCPP